MRVPGGTKRLLAMAAAVVMASLAITGSSSPNQLRPQAASYQDQINEYQQLLEDYRHQQEVLDAEIQQSKNDLENELAYQEDIQEQIKTVEETLQVLSDYILQLGKDIKQCEADIAQKEAEIETKRVEIENGKEAFMARLRAMYIAGDDSYSSILLGSEDFYDMLMKAELVKRVAKYDDEIIDELYDLKKQLEAEEVALNQKKEEYETQLDEYNAQKKEQDAQRVKLNELYEESENKADQLQEVIEDNTGSIGELDQEMEDLESTIADLVEQERQRKLEEERIRREEEERRRQEELAQQQSSGGTISGNASQGGEYTGDVYQSGSGVFAWPVPGFHNITYGVGWRWGAYHKGIDISSYGIRGATIRASDSGTVVKVNNSCPHDWGKNGSCGCGGGYGNYCIINHGNGFMTLYGHAQYITVSVGQEVQQGDALGIVGSTGFSTGDHLHFEIRLDGVAQNPLDYL